MKREDKEDCLKAMQAQIDSRPYASTIPYPYCCICFKRLTPDNIVENGDELWDVCLECNDKVNT